MADATVETFQRREALVDGSVTMSMAAPAERIWDVIADVRNTGKSSLARSMIGSICAAVVFTVPAGGAPGR